MPLVFSCDTPLNAEDIVSPLSTDSEEELVGDAILLNSTKSTESVYNVSRQACKDWFFAVRTGDRLTAVMFSKKRLLLS